MESTLPASSTATGERSPKLTDFKLLCFDCYGTLIDWETGILSALSPLLNKCPSGHPGWSRTETLNNFMAEESAVQNEHPDMLYSDILASSFTSLARSLGVTSTPAEAEEFGKSIATWQPWPDTVEALRILSHHFKLVILSNVDRKSFASTKKMLEQGFAFEKIITAEDVGSYKPALRNFEFMLNAAKEDYGIDSSEVLVTAISLFHDHGPANELGVHSAWIAREGSVMGMSGSATYDFRFDTLGDMAVQGEQESSSAT